jgi:glycosyltransferase involved in cell wall biosynthesis
MFRVMRGMARHHEVHLLSFYETERELEFLPELERVCANVRVIRRGQSLDQWRRDWLHQVPRAIAFEFGNPRMRGALAEALNGSDYDLVDVQFLQMTYALPRQRRVPALLTHLEVQHRVLAQRLRVSRSRPAQLALAIQYMRMLNYEIRACRRYDRVLAMTDADAAALKKWAPDLNVGFNNTGVDCSFFRPVRRDVDADTIVFAGYYRHEPNVGAALYLCREVLPRLRVEVPNVRVILAGGEPPEAVRELAHDPSITVTGWIDDLREVVARAAVFVVPIVSGAGLRGKVLEAWAMGKAVVTTSLAVEGLKVEHGRNALVADTPADFARAIATLLRNPERREQLAAAALTTARRHYDWSVTLAQLEQEYEAVVRGPAERWCAPRSADVP